MKDLTALLPHPEFDEGACTRRHDSGCAACVAACPKQALTISGRTPPVVDVASCIACGVCAVACPAGAVSGVGSRADELVDAAAEARDKASTVGAGGVPELVVRCRQVTASADGSLRPVVVGCLAAVDPEALAAAAGAMGRGSVVLERSVCEQCPVAPVERVAEVLGSGAALARCVAPEVVLSDRLVERCEPARRQASYGRRFGRRAFLAPTTDPGADNARDPARRGEGPSARALLLEVAADVPLPQVRVEASRCSGCEACAKVCAPHGLVVREQPGCSELVFDPRACLDCGECVRICPEDAIRSLGRTGGQRGRLIVARWRDSRCARCEAVLAPGESGHCARCEGRQGMVSDVWAQVLG